MPVGDTGRLGLGVLIGDQVLQGSVVLGAAAEADHGFGKPPKAAALAPGTARSRRARRAEARAPPLLALRGLPLLHQVAPLVLQVHRGPLVGAEELLVRLVNRNPIDAAVGAKPVVDDPELTRLFQLLVPADQRRGLRDAPELAAHLAPVHVTRGDLVSVPEL